MSQVSGVVLCTAVSEEDVYGARFRPCTRAG